MTNKPLSIFNQLRPLSVGLMTYLIILNQCLMIQHLYEPNYPPYNIVKIINNKFDIEIALIRILNKKDIDVTSENDMLTIESKVKSEDEVKR